MPPSTPQPAVHEHRLLAPLPADATVRRQPVAATLPTDARGPIDGWEQFVVELTEGVQLRRIVQVVTDATGALVSAGDHVMSATADAPARAKRAPGGAAEAPDDLWYHESIGGRFEAGGEFRGTHWRMWSLATTDDDEEGAAETEDDSGAAHALPAPERRAATADEADALRRLATDVLVRAGGAPKR